MYAAPQSCSSQVSIMEVYDQSTHYVCFGILRHHFLKEAAIHHPAMEDTNPISSVVNTHSPNPLDLLELENL